MRTNFRGVTQPYLAEAFEMVQVLVDIHFVAVEDEHLLNNHLTAMYQVGQFL